MVSILVVSRDRRDLLNRVLDDLRQQVFDGEFEIVVVEETDNPQAPEDVVYVPHPMKNLGIAYARNMSVQHAKHDVLVFIDDDCRVDDDWLSQLVYPLKDESVLGVQGGVTVPEETNAIGWAESVLGFPGGGVSRVYQANGQPQETREVSTLNACYRKHAVEQAGCFSAHARFGGEDYLLARRVAEQGKLLFVPQAVVRHEARGRLAAIWFWFVRRGRAEFDLWRSGLAPENYGVWMLQSSQSLKLLPFLILSYWTILPLMIVLAALISMNMWRFRWVLQHQDIPFAAWLWLPVVHFTMSMAIDFGRSKAWMLKS